MMSMLESVTLILSGGGKMREKFGRILLEE